MPQSLTSQPEGMTAIREQKTVVASQHPSSREAPPPGSSSSSVTTARSPSPSIRDPVEDVTPPSAELDASDPGPAPNGGLRAWLQVAAGHLAVFNAWGYINSFGIFQGTYATYLHQAPSTISWIGSLQVFFVLAIGAFSGRALDGGYYRWVTCIGTVLQLVGIFTTSAAHEGAYWQVLLAQGVCQGLGFGCFFAPSIAVVSQYFTTRRTIAIQFTACGGATGGIVFPLIAQRLLPRLGFAWTIRVMGFVVLFNSIFILLVMRPRLPPRKSGPIVEFSAFREAPYLLYCIASFFTLWGAYIAYYYSRVYALNVLDSDASTSFTVLLVLNALGVPGRVIPGLIADRFSPRSPIFVMTPCILFASLVTYCWSTVHSVQHYWIWIAFYGFFGASIQGLFTATLPSLFDDPSKNGTRIGMCFSIVSLAALTGPPLAGQIIQADGGSYVGMSVWAGSTLLLGSVISGAAGWKLLRGTKRVTEK